MHASDADRLRRMLAAHAAGDEAAYEAQMAQLLAEREQGLFVSVARLTRELHQSIFDAKQDGNISRFAQEQLPDACSRLDYVVQLTERAAHQTLDLVDRSRESLQCMTSACATLDAVPPPAAPVMLDARQRLHGAIDALRGHLSELAQVQEYQDISGQLVRNVIELVRGVEASLLQLLRGAGGLPASAASTKPGLHGPAVPGLSASALNQHDADQLLSSLGF